MTSEQVGYRDYRDAESKLVRECIEGKERHPIFGDGKITIDRLDDWIEGLLVCDDFFFVLEVAYSRCKCTTVKLFAREGDPIVPWRLEIGEGHGELSKEEAIQQIIEFERNISRFQ